MNDKSPHPPLPPVSDEQIGREMRAIFAIAEPDEVGGRARIELGKAAAAALDAVLDEGMPRDKAKREALIATLRKNRNAMERLAADLLKGQQ